jgi:hypothetical protein
MRMTKVWAVVIASMGAAVLGAACGDDSGGSGGGGTSAACENVACDNVKKFADLPWTECTGCHSNDAQVRIDNGVPGDSDYTTYQGVSSRIQTIAERVASTGSDKMPPVAALSDAVKQDFITWGCCDGPQ